MADNLNTTRLAELIDQKADLLDQILQLVLRQQEIVNEGQLAALMSLLSAKQGLLDRLQTLEKSLDPFRAEDPDQRVWPSAAARQACRERAEHATATLNQVLQIEQRCEQHLSRRRDEVATQLETNKSGADAAAAYLSAAPASPRRLDLTSEA